MDVSKINKMYEEIPGGYTEIIRINFYKLEADQKFMKTASKIGRYYRWMNNLMYYNGSVSSVYEYIIFNMGFKYKHITNEDILKHLNKYDPETTTNYFSKLSYFKWDEAALVDFFNNDRGLILEYKQSVGAKLAGKTNHINKVNKIMDYVESVEYTSVKDIVEHTSISNKTVINILKQSNDTSKVIDNRLLLNYKILYKTFNDITEKGNRVYTNEDIINHLKGSVSRRTYYRLMNIFSTFQEQLDEHNRIMISNENYRLNG